MLDWTNYQSSFTSSFENYHNKLITLLLRFTTFWYEIREGQNWIHPKKHIADALALEAELVAWAANATEQLKYDTIKSDDEKAFKGGFHVYKSFWAANAWNAYRSIRIILLQVLIGGITQLSREGNDISEVVGVASNNRAQLMFSKAALYQLMIDICRSVPYMMDWSLNSMPSNSCPKLTAAALTLWPLYTAAVIKVARIDTSETTTFIIKCLREIAQEVGNKQAASMAHVLSIQKELTDWKEGDVVNIDTIDLELDMD